MDDEDLEALAEHTARRVGVTGHGADTREIARRLGLRVEVVHGARPLLYARRVIVLPAVCEQAQAYFAGHEIGHWLLDGVLDEGPGLERACSRVGCALLLPRAQFAEDIAACSGVAEVIARWPLATRKIVRRRMGELAR